MDTPDPLTQALARCVADLAGGDPTARDRILEICSERLRLMAHRMLGRFPRVRRWEDTDDVFQNAALRLHRSLGAEPVDSPRAVMALAATHIHRELIDLARRHSGPSSYAANHATNAITPADRHEGPVHHVELAADADSSLDRWTQFHEAVRRLPDEDREVFNLVWYLAADQQTVADLLGCSVRTVKTRWRRARDSVKAALDGRSPEVG